MNIDTSPGYIFFSLEPKDWKLHAKDFLKELKESIPLDDRDYDENTQQWTIKERWKYVFYDLRDKYFRDKNQMEMFR